MLQLLRLPQTAFSAALTAHVEAHYADEADRNRLCGPVPLPRALADYPAALAAGMTNQYHWSQDQALRRWIRSSRLDSFGRLISGADRDDPRQLAVLTRLREGVMAAASNLPGLVAAMAGPVRVLFTSTWLLLVPLRPNVQLNQDRWAQLVCDDLDQRAGLPATLQRQITDLQGMPSL